MERYTKAMGIAALAGALLFAAIAVPLTVQSATAAAGANMTKNATAAAGANMTQPLVAANASQHLSTGYK